MTNQTQVFQVVRVTDNEIGTGTILSDRYELTDIIGRGGFGHVYKARQLNMDRDVAVKILPREFMSISDVVERFKREAKLASRLRHPNTITLHDYGQHEESLFIVMELLTGEDLADVLKREGRLPIDRIFHIATGILKSLSEAHRHGIVHRDLKPENIFLSVVGDDRDHVKVLDFGIAKIAQDKVDDGRKLTLSGSTVGTPAYMSPEQAAGEEVDGQTDLYALGVMMYEMACGRPPYHDDDAVKVMRSHLFDPVPPLRDERLRGTLIDMVISKALQKERAQRFKSASEFLLALAGEPVARPVIAGLNPDLARKRRVTEDTGPTTDDLTDIASESGNHGTLAYAKSVDDSVPFSEVPDTKPPRERATVSSNLTDASGSGINDAPPGFRRDSAANTSSIIKVIEPDEDSDVEDDQVILLTKRKTPGAHNAESSQEIETKDDVDVDIDANLRESDENTTPTTEEILAVRDGEEDPLEKPEKKRSDWSFGSETMPGQSASFDAKTSSGKIAIGIALFVLIVIAFFTRNLWL